MPHPTFPFEVFELPTFPIHREKILCTLFEFFIESLAAHYTIIKCKIHQSHWRTNYTSYRIISGKFKSFVLPENTLLNSHIIGRTKKKRKFFHRKEKHMIIGSSWWLKKKSLINWQEKTRERKKKYFTKWW